MKAEILWDMIPCLLVTSEKNYLATCYLNPNALNILRKVVAPEKWKRVVKQSHLTLILQQPVYYRGFHKYSSISQNVSFLTSIFNLSPIVSWFLSPSKDQYKFESHRTLDSELGKLEWNVLFISIFLLKEINRFSTFYKTNWVI